MKKFICIVLAMMMVFGLCGCGGEKATQTVTEPVVPTNAPAPVPTNEPAAALKVGLICLHDANSTYDKNFIDAFNAACEAEGVEGFIKTGVGESNEAYEAAAQLADSGCKLVFADSFGHEGYLIQAANEFTDVEFCHATGTRAHTEGFANYHNAFAAIYEGRYLAGVAAGMKLKELVENGAEPVVGYVGAYSYAEVISGYTAFYLGVKSLVPEATMKVTFTGSWYDETAEKEAANKLVESGCVVLSAHADSMGMPTACEALGVPFVAYNGSFRAACPNTYIISTRINWAPYFQYAIQCVKEGKAIDIDWVGTVATGSVEMTEFNDAAAAPETMNTLEAASKSLMNGMHVFDIASFTVNGEQLTSYMADVDSDEAYEGDTEVVIDGYFHESEFRSAPYFDLNIDGIELLNTAF